MADPTDLVLVGSGGSVVGGLIVAALKWSGSRNISALDKTLTDLAATAEALRKEVQHLREAHVGLVKGIGSLQKDNQPLRERIDGLAKHWNDKHEEHRRAVHDRMTVATRDMIAAIDAAKRPKR